MSKKNKNQLVPNLRFPKYQDKGEWSTREFKDLIELVEERAGTKKYTLMSVTSGVGLVSQLEKFGREIAGNAYKNYYVIKKGDFAYNKSATKQFPEGYIAMLTEHDTAALPNSIFTCFRIIDKNTCPKIFDHLFHANYHGSWLRNFIAVGARAHGSLNIDTKHLLDMPVVLPTLPEQQKIADCLTSLDELIAAEAAKLEAYKVHKKGLMQKLFPAEGQTVPQWRFPEFRGKGEWEEKKFGQLCQFVRGPFGGAIRKDIFVSDGYAVYEQSHAIYSDFNSFRYFITQEKYKELNRFSVRPGDIIMSCSGTMGKFSVIPKSFKEGVINQALLKLTVNKGYHLDFMKFTLEFPINQEKILSQSAGGAIKNVVGVGQMKETGLCVPLEEEQHKIADCLSSLDDLITVQTQKVEALKAHKKGLMQGLFPSADEVGE